MPALPKEVNLEGHIDERGIAYIGIATLQPNGEYHVLANVEGCLCRVSCKIRPKAETCTTPVGLDAV